MTKYRKKPIVIEAIKWTSKNEREMFDFLEPDKQDQYMESVGKNFYIDHNKVKGGLMLKTLEGEHKASIGDFVIKGISGEFYPCKPDIFEATYEKVDLQAADKIVDRSFITGDDIDELIDEEEEEDDDDQ